ncbi:uncharacterized protein BX663DRAFT_493468 [Cokeromyces recurvatus]|uniref:uncharacterized protein n=1 Tax=Cokeromyces recurvatus TaxID=90255 RepID=UPI00221F37F0|nr:uncharacterized protein BX663DRAFT_493468 [Cokeromyces recurvatus]KAI7908233.1 hypothetical protein BX663DRAFT_493468 [Cokeromyces recurvatus]
MGQFISSLTLRHGDSTIVPELGFDLENATPSNEELQLYNKLFSILIKPVPTLLHLLKNYVPASEQISNAIAKPTPENDSKAWDAVSSTVNILRDIYEYSNDLKENLPTLLTVLCQGDVNKNLEKNRGLAKLFAELLDFVFEFDQIKMHNPTLQNDFSYYRRMLQRGRYSVSIDENVSDLRSAMMENEQANHISFFIAYPTPMLKCIIDTTTHFVNKNKLQKSVGDCLAVLWSTCFNTVNKKRNTINHNTSTFCMKVMVACIILYDHINPNGVFYKNSPINIKNSVKAIQTTPIVNLSNTNDYTAANLLSALKYNSKHLNDDTTPKNIKNLVLAT